MSNRVDARFYPGWTRKAITFSIDDGYVPTDKKFMEILRPAGIRGTFNLCSHSANKMTPEEYREFYRDYEIANHCKYHPFAISENVQYRLCEEPFDPTIRDHVELAKEKGIAAKLLYRTDEEGLYQYNQRGGRYRVAEGEKYIALIREGHEELEAIFGKGSVRGYVWPFDRQENPVVEAYLRHNDLGYKSVRKTGERGAEEGFPVPKQRIYWQYTAIHNNFLEKAAAYAALPDDGELKFFCLGVHSADYEYAGKWEDLKRFAELYGNRPEAFYSAPVSEIFDYADAVEQIIITEKEVVNPTAIDVYLKIDGEKQILKAGESRSLD